MSASVYATHLCQIAKHRYCTRVRLHPQRCTGIFLPRWWYVPEAEVADRQTSRSYSIVESRCQTMRYASSSACHQRRLETKCDRLSMSPYELLTADPADAHGREQSRSTWMMRKLAPTWSWVVVPAASDEFPGGAQPVWPQCEAAALARPRLCRRLGWGAPVSTLDVVPADGSGRDGPDM